MKRIGIIFWSLLIIGGIKAQTDQQYKSMDNPRMVRLLEMDSTAEAFFGETLSDRIANTRNIEVFKLSQFLPDTEKSIDVLEEFRILDTAAVGISEQQTIAKLLTGTEAYIQDKSIKNLCLFLPNLGLKLDVDEQPVNALISLKCKMVRFYYEMDESPVNYVELNIKQNFEGFDHFYKEVFPPKENKPISLFVSRKDDTTTSEKKALYYIVKKGEGWTHVARNASNKYGKKITMETIFKINKDKALNENKMLKPGDEILVGYEN